MKAEIANMLREAMGLDVSSIGRTSLEHALRSRMNACSLRDPKSYLERIKSSSAELQELIETIAVSETWFFRDREAFSALARVVMEEWWPAHAAQALRLASLPCSTGEEPYSIAMALLDAGFPPKRFKIDAIDISARSLATAKRAVYGNNSFRGRNLEFRDQHFRPTKGGHELAAAVRERVHFEQGNLVSEHFLGGSDPYDFIFCRNVLIYFDPTTQTRVVKTLRELLAPDGLLFVGPAETFLTRSCGFVSANWPQAFAYRKEEAPAPGHEAREPHQPHEPPRVKPKPPVRPIKAVPKQIALPDANESAVGVETASPVIPVIPVIPVESGLEAAASFADAGRLKEAANACEEFLRVREPSVAAYYLLGLVRSAMGEDRRAADSFRRVIYLEPDHAEALTHLALLAKKTGNSAAARRLEDRAHRSNR